MGDETGYGCDGGMPSMAMNWVREHGLASSQSYPYVGRSDSRCQPAAKIFHSTGYMKIRGDENQIAQALVEYGPLSITIDATHFWKFYTGGVITDPQCQNVHLDQSVNIVGYG